MNRFGIYLFGCLFVGVLLFAMAQGNFVLATVLIASLAAFRLVAVRHELIYWIIFLEALSMKLPISILREMPVAFFLQVFFVGGEMLYWILRPKERIPFRTPDKLLIAFMGMFLLMMKVRGFGLYMLGGSSLGGMEYVEKGFRFLFMLVAALSVRTYPLDAKRCFKCLLYGVLGLAFLRYLGGVSGAFAGFANKFFNVVTHFSVEEGESAKRLGVLTAIAVAGLPFVMSRPKLKTRVLLALVCISLAAASGFRSGLAAMILLYGVAEGYMYGVSARKLITGGVIGGVLFGILWLSAPSMDFRLQRTVSALPGMESRVEYEAVRSATTSTEWRKELYLASLKHVPEHALVGRGFGFTVGEVVSFLSIDFAREASLNPAIFYDNHSYHAALLDLLIDYGGVATLLLFLAMWVVIVQSTRALKGSNNPFRKYAVAYLIYALISICTIWSNFNGRLPRVIIAYVICSSFMYKTHQEVAGEEKRILPEAS